MQLGVIEHRKQERDAYLRQVRQQLRQLDIAVVTHGRQLEIMEPMAELNRALDRFLEAHR